MHDTPAGQAVRVSLESAAAARMLTSAERADLKRGVWSAVDELKSMGWPIEKIIVRLKEVAAEAGVPRQFDNHDREPVVKEIVEWCIERYFV